MKATSEREEWVFMGTRLRDQRKKTKLTQKDLAALLGLRQSAICDYERGHTTPSAKTIVSLAVILHTSSDYLLGLTENPSPTHSVIALPTKESELLEAFYSLSEERRERAIGILIGLREKFGSE